MAFFDDFTTALKQKWLQYFQSNYAWMTLQMELESIKTPDGGRRPPSYLILGVLNALEPKLAQLMLPFTRLNSDPDALIEVLGLNIDPDIALGNKPPLQASPAATQTIPEVPVASPIENAFDVSVENALEPEDSLDEEADLEPVMVVTTSTVEDDFTEEVAEEFVEEFVEEMVEESIDDDADASMDIALDDDFGDSAIEELPESEDVEAFGDIAIEELPESEDVEAFGDIALDDFANADTSFEETAEESDANLGNITDESESDFGGMGLDAWEAESTEEVNEDLLPDFGDITLDEFGADTPAKEGEDEELDAFGDLNFDPFSDPTSKSDKEKEEDVWGK